MSDTSATPEGGFIPESKIAKSERSPHAVEPAFASVKQEPSSFLRQHGATILIAFIVSALVAVPVAATISVGVNVWLRNSGDRLVHEKQAAVERDDRLLQEGHVFVNQNGEREVFYAEPFARPPKLDLEADNQRLVFVTIKEQKADHFTVQSSAQVDLRWRAEGVRPGKQ